MFNFNKKARHESKKDALATFTKALEPIKNDWLRGFLLLAGTFLLYCWPYLVLAVLAWNGKALALGPWLRFFGS